MLPLSERCSILREEVVNKRTYFPKFRAQSSVYRAVGFANAREAGMTNPEVIAEGIANVLDNFTPVIIPGEWIVGFNFDAAHDGFFPEDSEEGRRECRENGISDGTAERFFSTVRTCMQGFYVDDPELTKEEQDSQTEWAAIGRCIDSNHSVLGYEKVVTLGFDGLYDQVCRWEAVNGDLPLYRAMKRICKAAGRLGDAYAAEAKRLLASGDPQYNSEDLEKIIDACSRVPHKPARNLQEAVQALWFAHIVNTWEDYVNANSLGRLDQIFYPYYKADLEAGRITKEDAFELICCLWIKLYRDYDVQQSCVGGTDENGNSTVNDLSYMMLDAAEQLNFIRCMSVRFSQKTEPEFMRRAMEVVGHVQKGIPFFFNDDVMIPALESVGISHKDACNYTHIGCVETVIPGKSNPHAVTGETNLLKALEYVFCNGNSMMYPEFAPGLKTGEVETFETFEQLYQAVLAQVDRILDLTCSKVKKYRIPSIHNAPRPYKSLLSEGCMESGRDFNDAGCVYDYYQIMFGGVPNLADSLAVIRKFVYEEKRYTLSEIKRILEEDFPDEAVRAEFINHAPKFGNDIDEVDSIAADIIDHGCTTLEKLSETYGLSFHAQPFTYLWMVDHGNTSAASPDGRRKGEIIAYSVSPMQGRDFSGLTAVFNSISKLPSVRTPGTTSAIIEVDPKLFSDSNIGMLTDILMESAARGLGNVQFNTIDADTLIDAQKNPERYNNLAVRVSGFSQKFNLLSRPLQDHIIGRTKHRCL